MIAFMPGQRFVSQLEPDLGLGIVTEIQGRTVKFNFPAVNQCRMYRTDSAPVDRYVLQPGETAKNEKGVSFVVESVRDAGGLIVYVGRGGREIKESELNSKVSSRPADFFKALVNNETFSCKEFARRENAMKLSCKWQSSLVRGMIGPRVDMIPHQYYLCYRACASSTLPRLMLSDEVGLGKTIEAGMIWHALKARNRVSRTLIIVPETLKHQWMIEMKRRFNQLFTLVDEGYIRGLFVAVDKEEEKPNPFLQSSDIICSIDFLMEQPALIEDLLKTNWDMTIIDEAHHLVCEDGFTSREYMLANAILAKSKGILLLTGTPLQLHPESQFNRLRMLDPARFADYNEFIKSQETYRKLVNDLSKLPTDPNHHMSWDDLYESVPKNSPIRPWLEQENSKSMPAGEWMRRIVDAMGTGSVVFRNTRKGVGGFPKRVLDEICLKPDPKYREMVNIAAEKNLDASTDIQENGLLCTPYADAWAMDERFVWLKKFLKEYKDEKVLLICESIDVVQALGHLLTEYLGEGTFSMFHENMSIMARDKAAAWFSRPDGANLLIASEIGSEGRNFQFSHHLVLFDLPLDAALVEQRIGRLDRIGQTKDIVVHVPYVAGSGQEVMFRWYNEGLNAFGAPLMSGGELFLKYTDSLIEALADPQGCLEKFVASVIPQVKKDCEQMRKNIEKGRDKLLEFNSRNPEKAKEITDEIRRFDVDPELETLIVDSLRDRGLYVEPSSIPNCSVVTMGPQVEAGTIPGMPSQSMVAVAEFEEEQGSENVSLTVTFDRATAMIHDEIDFVSLEHPLAQGVIDFETGLSHGAVACNIWQNSGMRGLMMQYNFLVELPVLEEWGVADIAGPRYVSVVVDAKGEDHSDLVESLRCGQFKDVGVPQGNPAVDMTLKFFAKEGFSAARRIAMASAKEYAEAASLAVEARCEQEYQRMNHLLTMRGKGGNSAQLQQLRKNVQEWKKTVSNPQIRLDAIRLLVCR
ncbi:RNA polymerase-associated protein RapA [uncultured Fibrobacter sp.]|uniref:RNA polymerase-associated protein RapA n=1 Tax=uncultured Fibrobacter sp. TaxID=261512 RepID=UPI0025F72B61|nr:RNA polymerase-associated protein RapA [uncultured Fibrobacter sp.]